LLFFLSTSYFLLPSVGATLKVRKRILSISSAVSSNDANTSKAVIFQSLLSYLQNKCFSNNYFLNLCHAKLSLEIKKEQFQKNRFFSLGLMRSQSMRFLMTNVSKTIIYVL
jgi:hypothetical protein